MPGGSSGRLRGPFHGLPREVTVLTAVSFTVALGYGIAAPSIPAFARQFGVSVAAAASVISAFALMRVAFALPAGRLVDRFGSRRVMAIGIAVVAVSSTLAGFSQSFTQLLVLRGVGGLGSAMFSVSAQALLLASVPSGQRGRASAGSGLLDVAPSAMLGDLLSAQARQGGILVAFFQMAGDAGTVTGPVVAGLLVDGASYPAAFGLAGGVLAAAALLVLLTPESQNDRDTAPQLPV